MGRFLSAKEMKRRENVSAAMKRLHSNSLLVGNAASPKEFAKEEPIAWNDGRRIVELQELSKQLRACKSCKEPISFNVVGEKRMGLASELLIRCDLCGYSNTVLTSKTHSHGERGPSAFDVNTKAALGWENQDMQMRNETPSKGLAVKYDMCWQKRGSGRAYNSPSGVGTVIGQKTGKVLDFDICITHCSICRSSERANQTPKLHNCQKNWTKSSKAMESSTGAKLMQHIEKQSGTTVDVLIMDDDAATLSKVKESLLHDVDKWSDINHATRSLSNALYALQQKHKILSTSVIKYYKRCFSYAIHQNKNKEIQLKQTLSTIVPHSFGNHANCGTWCHAGDDNYSHKLLPHGKPLIGDSLQADIQVVFNTMANNSHRLCPAGSTTDVESINSMYASKAPKKVCYSSSESLRTRVSATVSQKNLGYNYLSRVNRAAGLSPNKITERFSYKLSAERKRKLEYTHRPEVKRRRLDAIKSDKTIQKEAKEGITYQSGISLDLVTEARDIPGIKKKPKLDKIANFAGNIIVFDLETTSLTADCGILQIAASSFSTGSAFNCYIQPTKPISPSASAVTCLTNKGGVLFYRGCPVAAETPEAAFQNFVLWLSQQKPVLLVAHNARTFDSRRLIYNVSQYSCFGCFKECVVAFSDTLPLFKEKYPSLKSYTQENIYKEIVSSEYDAHNATEDVASLHELMKVSNLTNEELLKYSFTLESLLELLHFDREVKKDVTTFSEMINKKYISYQMAIKIAESGLCKCHLEYAVQRKGYQGLVDLLTQKSSDESPRVTKTVSVIKKIWQYFH